jgi:hypothetical protein
MAWGEQGKIGSVDPKPTSGAFTARILATVAQILHKRDQLLSLNSAP